MEKKKRNKVLNLMHYTTVNGKLYITCPRIHSHSKMDYNACENRSQSSKTYFEDCHKCLHWADVMEEYQQDIMEKKKSTKKKVRKPIGGNKAGHYGKISTGRKRKALHI